MDWASKGGTCLSKVHSDFYRMSEDLDFAFSVPVDISRPQRSKLIGPMKEHLAKRAGRLACFKVVETLRGFNCIRRGENRKTVFTVLRSSPFWKYRYFPLPALS